MDEIIKSLVGTMENARLAARHKHKILMCVGLSLIAGGLFLGILGFELYANGTIPENMKSTMPLIGLVLILVGIGLAIGASSVKAKYQKVVVGTFRELVNKTLFPEAVFDPNRGLGFQKVMKPGFFQKPDRYFENSFMSATYKGIPFEQGFFRLERREESRDSKGNVTYTYVTYASGTMYHFTFERDFANTVKVVEKKGYSYMNDARDGLHKIETEYILFNKKFQTLCTDETTVFYLLTPQIQEKILSLEDKFKGFFFLSFLNNEMYIAVDDNGNSINVPWKVPVTYENLEPIVELLAIPAVFINLMGLAKAKFEKNAGVNYASDDNSSQLSAGARMDGLKRAASAVAPAVAEALVNSENAPAQPAAAPASETAKPAAEETTSNLTQNTDNKDIAPSDK